MYSQGSLPYRSSSRNAAGEYSWYDRVFESKCFTFGQPMKDNCRTNYCYASKATDNTTNNRRGAVGGDGQCSVSRFVRLESIWRSTNSGGVVKRCGDSLDFFGRLRGKGGSRCSYGRQNSRGFELAVRQARVILTGSDRNEWTGSRIRHGPGG